MTLARKTIVVTGAAGAIGHAIVARLAHDGARVHALDLTPPECAGATVTGSGVDVADEGSVRAFFDGLAAEGTRLDGLVNNAGIPGEAALVDLERRLWDRVFAVNVTGQMLMAKYALPLLRAEASIVNVSSIAGTLGYAERAAYCASKAAIMGFTRALAVELGPRGIRVNCVAPGTIDTPWIDRLIASAPDPSAARHAFAARAPMNRMGGTDELAGLIAFLMSEDSRFLSGAVIPCDGAAAIRG